MPVISSKALADNIVEIQGRPLQTLAFERVARPPEKKASRYPAAAAAAAAAVVSAVVVVPVDINPASRRLPSRCLRNAISRIGVTSVVPRRNENESKLGV